ncbi:MAG: potassium channel family protein [Acidimicrobiales bacterium]
MRVVIAGAGNVGVFLAQDLVAAGHEVLVVEKDPEVVARLLASETQHGDTERSSAASGGGALPDSKVSLGVEWLLGDACDMRVLQTAKLETAEVMVAATGDDEDNLVVSLLAKQEFAVPRVVGRVNHPKNHWLFKPTWGVDVSVSTPHLLSALVQEAVSVGSLVRLLTLEGGGARLVEVTLAEGSPVAGLTIRTLGLPRDATIVAVVRNNHVVVPRGDTALTTGDEVLALVTPDSEDKVRNVLLGSPQGPPQTGA